MVDKVNVTMNPGDDPEVIAKQKEADAKSAETFDKHTADAAGEKTPEELAAEKLAAEKTEVPVRPEAIPEKFWNAETGAVDTVAMIKEETYRKEQEAKDKEGEGKPKEDSSNEGDDGESDDKSANSQSKVVEAASAEWAEKGELSEATYEGLDKQGLTREMVDAYISGQEAAVGAVQEAAWGQFDGKENYAKATDWARENLSETEIATLDVQITSTNPAIVAEGAKALKAKYDAGADITPDTTITGNNGAKTGGAHYKSTAEMQADMSNPKYKIDPAFRKSVADKIARAGEAGVNLF